MGRLSSLPSALVTDDSALGGLVVERSLRIDDGDNASLTRTPSSASNRRTFTISVWAKRSSLNGSAMFGAYIDNSDRATLRFNSDNIEFQSAGASVKTTGKFRDTTGWYHIVAAIDTTQGTQSNRGKIYVNGVQQDLSSNNLGQNVQTSVNNNSVQVFGTRWVSGAPNGNFDGYIAEINLIDGLQLDASYFGYTDFQTKTWKPKVYSGSYGTNGVRLDFSDNSAATAVTLGKDRSGQGNDFTPSNIVVGDSVLDTPSNNFATIKTLGTPAVTTIGEGNLYLDTNNTGQARANRSTGMSTYFVNSGKWYCEHYHLAVHTMIGVAPPQIMIPYTSNNSRYVMVYSGGGNKYVNTNGSESNSTYATNYYNNNVTGILLDMDQTTPVVYFSYNGQWANGSGAWNQSNPYTSGGAIPLNNSFFTTSVDKAFEGYCGFWSSQAGGTEARHIYNFGQDSTFAGRTTAGGHKDATGIGDFKYPVPDGAMALCSNNLSRLDNQRNTTSLIDPKKHFGVVTWSGNSSTSNRKISGLEFQPDLVWTKTRNHTYHHVWMDSVRGPNNRLNSDQNFVENHTNGGYLASFDHDGFTWQYGGGSGNEWWNISKNYAAFCWKAGGTAVSNSDGTITSSVSANQEAGFSIVTYTGTGSDASVGHGLGAKPQVLFVKSRTHTDNWKVWFKGVTTSDAYSWQLDTNGSNYSGSDKWYNSPNGNDTTTTTFGVSGDNATNRSGATFVAYCWTAIKGYSSFGTYEGNGQADGPYVYLGFRPAMIICKSYSNSGSSYNWFMCDSTRGPYNNIYQRFQPNTTDSEVTDASNAATVDFLNDGFKLRGTGSMINGNTVEYVYMAWAEQSTNTPYASETNAR